MFFNSLVTKTLTVFGHFRIMLNSNGRKKKYIRKPCHGNKVNLSKMILKSMKRYGKRKDQESTWRNFVESFESLKRESPHVF